MDTVTLDTLYHLVADQAMEFVIREVTTTTPFMTARNPIHAWLILKLKPLLVVKHVARLLLPPLPPNK